MTQYHVTLVTITTKKTIVEADTPVGVLSEISSPEIQWQESPPSESFEIKPAKNHEKQNFTNRVYRVKA